MKCDRKGRERKREREREIDREGNTSSKRPDSNPGHCCKAITTLKPQQYALILVAVV